MTVDSTIGDADVVSGALSYGVFSADTGAPRVGVAQGSGVLDLAALADDGVLDELDGVWRTPSLNAFMALGPKAWSRVRGQIVDLVHSTRNQQSLSRHRRPLEQVTMHLPFEVADFVDFYSSEAHATNAGRIFRPDGAPLLPNWKQLPVGYHGRAGTVVASDTEIVRPSGQRLDKLGSPPVFGPSTRLDIETEVGFVVGMPSRLGEPVGVDEFRSHVFGVVLLNDWSARDLQAWEYVPLGPFLGKSFATSISTWVVPIDALDAAWVAAPAQDPEPLPYLRGAGSLGLDLAMEVALNGHVVSRPPFAQMYWTPAQQLAHMTVNGASLRTGDLFGSGTVSGWADDERGSLLEMSWNGTTPFTLPDGTTRGYLEDGDTVTITATAPASGGGRMSLGEVTGTIQAAR